MDPVTFTEELQKRIGQQAMLFAIDNFTNPSQELITIIQSAMLIGSSTTMAFQTEIEAQERAEIEHGTTRVQG